MLAKVVNKQCIRYFSGCSHASRIGELHEAIKTGPDFDTFVNKEDKNEGGCHPHPVKKNKKLHRLPPWLKAELPSGENYLHLKNTVEKLNLATVCQEAKCPNIGECWNGKEGLATATIMLMGDTCTRGCKFCNVKTSSHPKPVDPNEPVHVAQAVADWGLSYVVLTSVDRDDMPDLGASHITQTIQELKKRAPKILVECLTPDFQGKKELIEQVAMSGLNVYAHNIETVERLTEDVRDYRAHYRQSLKVLEIAKAKNPKLITKSSIMLGLGETDEEVLQTMKDLLNSGVEILTLGQYLRPTKGHIPVVSFPTPEQYNAWKIKGEELGFKYVASSPLVRSSYKAGEFYLKSMLKDRENNEKKN
ncbi:hypothetical protein WA158_007203 [Blastocystis sp. Blastoise]